MILSLLLAVALAWCVRPALTEKNDCRLDKLPSVEHGKPLERQSVAHGSFALYNCEETFDLRNYGRLQCRSGSWKGEPPVCVKARCIVPHSPNSTVLRYKSSYFLLQKETVKPGQEVAEDEGNLVVKCREGFKLPGPASGDQLRRHHASEASLRCYRGHWLPRDPWCIQTRCIVPHSPNSTVLRYKSSYFLLKKETVKPGQEVAEDEGNLVVKCREGFQLRRPASDDQLRRHHASEASLRCYRGHWLPRDPWCIQMVAIHRKDRSCKLPLRENRFKAYQGHEGIRPLMRVPHGAKLRFHCEPVGTTILRGSRTSTCINGNWTEVLPFCNDPEPNSINMELKTENHTGPGGLVYVEPDKEVEIECRSDRPVELVRNAQLIDGPYNDRSRQTALRATFKLTRNESTEIICRHIEENPGQSQSITVVARYRYDCPMPNPATSTLNIRRKNLETYEFSCRPPSVLQGRKKILHCLVYGEWDNDFPTCVLPSSPAPYPENGFPVRVDSQKPTPPSQGNRSRCTLTALVDGHFVRHRQNGTTKQVETGNQLAHGTVAYLRCNTASPYKRVRCVNGTWQPHPACDGGTQPPSDGMFPGNLQPSHQALPIGKRIKEPVDGAVEHETGVDNKSTAGNVNREGQRELGTALVSSQGDQSSSSRCLSPDTCISTQEGANIPRNLNSPGNDGANSFQRFTTSPEVPEHFPSRSTPAAMESVSQIVTPFNRGEPDVPTAPPTAPPTDDEIVFDLKARTVESVSTASSIISQPNEETYAEAPDTSTGFTDVGPTRPEGKRDLGAPIHGGAPAPSALTTAQPAESVNATSTEVTVPTFSDPAEATTTPFPSIAPVPRIKGCANFETGPDGPAVEGRKNFYGFGDSITFSCLNGAELHPRIERMICLGDKWGWSERRLPTCIPVQDEPADK